MRRVEVGSQQIVIVDEIRKDAAVRRSNPLAAADRCKHVTFVAQRHRVSS
jgi:hypothetical protein